MQPWRHPRFAWAAMAAVRMGLCQGPEVPQGTGHFVHFLPLLVAVSTDCRLAFGQKYLEEDNSLL